jgi:hypothetical protein
MNKKHCIESKQFSVYSQSNKTSSTTVSRRLPSDRYLDFLNELGTSSNQSTKCLEKLIDTEENF